MRLEEVFDGLHLSAEPVGLCVVSGGWRLRLPPSPEPTLHFVLAGHGQLVVAGTTTHELVRHTLALVPAGPAHVIQGDGDAVHTATATPRRPRPPGLTRWEAGPAGPDELVVACGHLRAIHAGGFGIFDLLDEPLVLDFSTSRDMPEVFDHLLAESRGDADGGQAMIAALMQQCLVLVFREMYAASQWELPWLDALDSPRLRGVIDAVLTRPQDSHSLASMASLAGMSRSAFARDFARGLGLTPKAFVRQVRMRRAAQMLRGTDLTVLAIAHQVGFASRSHFTQAFASEVGQSPSFYRAEHRSSPTRHGGAS